MTELKLENFIKSDVYDYEADVVIWGKKTGFGVKCYKKTLEEILPNINRLLTLLDNGRDKIVDALIKGGMIELAEDWASSAEEDEDEEDCYIMEDGTKVKLPITEEQFAASVVMDGMSIYYDEDEVGELSASLYVVCQPDYFACHCIEIYLDGDLNIDVNGLAG